MALNDLTKLLQSMQKEESFEEIFLNELALTAQKEALKEQRKPSQTYKPSSIGGCKRMLYYILIGEEPTDSKQTLEGIGIAESGTDRHERLQTLITKMPYIKWVDVSEYLLKREHLCTDVVNKQGLETKCYNKLYNMSFLCDGIIRYKDTPYIVEIKTEMSTKFYKRFAPEPKHLLQATCYSICLDIDQVLFIYEERGICLKKAYLVHITNEMKKEVYNIIDTVNKAVEAMEVPDKSTDKKDCTYCQYKGACRK